MRCFRPFLLLVAFIALLAGMNTPSRAADPWPGTPTDWFGFARHEFDVDGHKASVVVPREPAPGRPWVWHGEFFGHKPAPDVALLRRGFHVVYLSVPDMLGSPKAMTHWEALHTHLTTRHDLAQRPGLVGLSRGGLYVYNWATSHPDKVACVYGDAPVCDFKSWPGGRGTGPGSKRDWQLVLSSYAFKDEAEALAYPGNPVDRLAPLAKARIPLLHVFGDADEVVPWTENTGLLADRYRQLGGDITFIRKPGVKHHPHGLDDPTPIVEFLWKNAGPSVVGRTPEERAAPPKESQKP